MIFTTQEIKMVTKRRKYDLYETPHWVVESLFSYLPIQKDKTYLEPCRASGRIYSKLPEGSLWGEIREGIDYLTTPYPKVDFIITNPPFSLAQEFVTKSLTEAKVVVMLLRLTFLESLKRCEWWNDNKLTSLFVLAKRPSFTEDGKTDGSGYAWFVWDKENVLDLPPFVFLDCKEWKNRERKRKPKKSSRKSKRKEKNTS